jgi:hypothetical protein
MDCNANVGTEPKVMRAYVYRSLSLLAAAALCAAGAAFGGDGINVNVTNDGVEDVYVTIYDNTTKSPLIEHARLNGFSSLSVSANPDDSGRASISWTTISVDNRERHCGRGSRTGIDNDATLNVHADSSC